MLSPSYETKSRDQWLRVPGWSYKQRKGAPEKANNKFSLKMIEVKAHFGTEGSVMDVWADHHAAQM